MSLFRTFLARVMIFAMLLSGCQQQTTTSGVQSGYRPDSTSQNVFTSALDVPVAVDHILGKSPNLQGTIRKVLQNPAVMKEIENAVKGCSDVSCFEKRLIGSAKRNPGAPRLPEDQYQRIRDAYLAVSKNKSLSISPSLLASNWSSFEASGLALTRDAGDSESGPPPGSEDVAAIVPALVLVGVMIASIAIMVGCSAIVDVTKNAPGFLAYLMTFGFAACGFVAGIGTVVSFFATLVKLIDVP